MQFLFIGSRARTSKPGLRTYIRGGTNPVGPGTTWVRRYFITKDITADENPGYCADDYEAQHSTVDDNARYVDVKDYEKQLNQLPSAALRKAMRHGEWVMEGQFFSEWEERRAIRDAAGELIGWHDWHVIEKLPTHKGKSIVDCNWVDVIRVVDWGYAEEGNPGMVQWWACLPGPRMICFKEWVFKLTLPADVAKEITKRSLGMKVRYTVMDTQMFAEHEGPSVGELMAREGISGIEADKEREAGWLNVHTWLRETVYVGTTEVPRLQFLKPRYPGDELGCPVTIRSLPQMVVNPKNPSDMVTVGVEDEGADDTRYAVMSRPGASVENEAPRESQWIRDHITKKTRQRSRMGAENTRRSA